MSNFKLKCISTLENGGPVLEEMLRLAMMGLSRGEVIKNMLANPEFKDCTEGSLKRLWKAHDIKQHVDAQKSYDVKQMLQDRRDDLYQSAKEMQEEIVAGLEQIPEMFHQAIEDVKALPGTQKAEGIVSVLKNLASATAIMESFVGPSLRVPRGQDLTGERLETHTPKGDDLVGLYPDRAS